jgi:hypothetical protein
LPGCERIFEEKRREPGLPGFKGFERRKGMSNNRTRNIEYRSV